MNSLRWAELRVGLTAAFDVTVTTEMITRFRELSGDLNPLHHDTDFAAAAGYPAPIAFGMLTASFYSTLVGVHLPGRFAILQGIDLDFHRPVYSGAQLSVSGEISFLSEAVRRVELSAAIRDSAGQRVSKARIRVGLHEH